MSSFSAQNVCPGRAFSSKSGFTRINSVMLFNEKSSHPDPWRTVAQASGVFPK
jgi:hypothetical protein